MYMRAEMKDIRRHKKYILIKLKRKQERIYTNMYMRAEMKDIRSIY